MVKINLAKKGWQWLALLTLAFIWGSSFILMKKGLNSFSNSQVAALRLFISFFVLIPVVIKNLKKIRLSNLKSLLIIGVVGVAIPSILFTTAQTRINSSLAGMLNSLTPIFTLLIGAIFYRSGIDRYKTTGVIIGFCGALGMVFQGGTSFIGSFNSYSFLIVFATFCYGITANEVKYRLEKLDGLAITALGFLFIGPPAGVFLLFSDFSPALLTQDWIVNLLYIFVLAVFGSVFALIIYNSLIKHTSALFSASVTYIIPVFAIFWGIADGEMITISQLIFISMILFGIFLINQGSGNKILKKKHDYPKS